MSALDYLGGVTANTRDKAARALAFLESKGHHPSHFWGYDPNPANTEHHSRTAVDFMVFGNHWAGDELAEWLWDNRVAVGLKHLIWKQRIRSTTVEPGVWRAMADRGSPTKNHMDHVHAWFYDTPWRVQAPSPVPTVPATPPAPKPPAPKPTPAPAPKGLNVKLIDLRDVSPYVTGPGVKPLQRLLGVPADGLAGAGTRAALGRAQVRIFGKADYMFGPATAEALLAGK